MIPHPLPPSTLLLRGQRRLDGNEWLVVVVVVRVAPAAPRAHHAGLVLSSIVLPPPTIVCRRRAVLVVDGRLHVVRVVHHPGPPRICPRGGVRGGWGGAAGRRERWRLLLLLLPVLLLLQLRAAAWGEGCVLGLVVLVGAGAPEGLGLLGGVMVHLLLLLHRLRRLLHRL